MSLRFKIKKSLYGLLKKKFVPPALILMYHRTEKQNMDPWSINVTPEHFAEHLSIINKYAYPISLENLVKGMEDEKVNPRSVVVTFDDGYLSNLLYTKPLLEQFAVPATFFITSGKIDSTREFWWDELEQVLLKPGKLPEELTLEIDGVEHKWILGKACEYKIDQYKKDINLKAWEGKKESRLDFYYSIWKLIRPLPEIKQRKLIDTIAKWANTEIELRESHRTLTENELKELGKSELIEIGAHTIDHPVLTAQIRSTQEKEVLGSKDVLEKIFRYPITSFAYPHGEYSQETAEIVKSNGFYCACTTEEIPIRLDHNFFSLPRKQIEDCDGKSFYKILDNSFRKQWNGKW